MGRPTKANSLTSADIVAAAISVIDAEGPDALSVSRVARALSIKPPAIYKHLPGNAGLHRAVALALWQQYITFCRSRVETIEDNRNRLRTSLRATREFAIQQPHLFQVMVSYVLAPDDAEAAAVILETQQFVATALQLHGLQADRLIDALRMITATINGFITFEQRGNLTLPRSTEDSFEVILEALLLAVEHIRDRS